jgi:uncharacterized OB-fold protein
MTKPAYAKPLPELTLPMKPYWEGLRKRRVMIQVCEDCGRFRFPAASVCPQCLSDESHWEAVSGKGRLVSVATFHKAYWPSFAADIPYSVIQVELDVGVNVYSNWFGSPPAHAAEGTPVMAQFEPVTDDVTLLKFEIAE